jgi:hypothetical protein
MPILQEYDFSEVIPEHSSKKTFMLRRWNPQVDRPKKITDLDGFEIEYPVFSFYVCVNREKFMPREKHTNEVEWMLSTTERTKGIAHELLYADQYAKYFDPLTGRTSKPIQIPTVDEEEALLCPTYLIEAMLLRIEEEYGIAFGDVNKFLSQQTTDAVQKYYYYWLKDHGVERDISHSRTIAYLTSDMRSQYRSLFLNALESCAQKYKIQKLDVAQLKKHVHNDTPFAKEFFSEISKSRFNYSKHEVMQYSEMVLTKKNGR